MKGRSCVKTSISRGLSLSTGRFAMTCPLVVSFGDWALDRTKCEEHSATFNYRIAKRFIRSLRRHDFRPECMVRPCVARELRRVGGKRSCINVSGLLLERGLLAIMDISARAISLADRLQPSHSGHQCSHAPGRPNLHLVSSSRRPRQVTVNFSRRTKRLTPRPALPRSFGHEPERSKRSAPACWRARSREHCGAAASWRRRSRV